MAYSVSSAYHTSIKDGLSPQDFMLVDRDALFNILSSKDGDFVAGSPSISRSVCESQDMTMGECPSASLTVTLANPYGDAIEFWSKRGSPDLGSNIWARAGIGVQTYKGISESGYRLRLDLFTDDNTIYVRNGALVITAQADASISGDTLYFGSTAPVSISGTTLTVTDSNDVSVYVDNSGNLYVGSNHVSGYSDAVSLHAVPATASSYYVYIGMSDGTVKLMAVTTDTSTMPTISTLTGDYDLGGVMVRKLTEIRQTVIYDYNGFPKKVCRYDNDLVTEEDWEYCPVGVYYIKVPKYNLHSAYIDITDAMDAMSLLDCNLKELSEAEQFSLTGNAVDIINNICIAKGIDQRSLYTLGEYAIPVPENAVGADITCRQFFKWVGERAGHLWKMDPDGYLTVYVPPAFQGSSVDYTLDDNYLVAGYEIYNEFVDPPEKLVIYYGEDNVYTSQPSSPSSDNYYKITGNPLFNDPEAEYPALPWLEYNDLPLKSYQIADCSTVSADPSYGYGDALYVSTQETYRTYIMRETLSFGIRVMAHYSATGSDTRLDTTSATYTGMVVSAMGERVDELPDSEEVEGQISQAIQDAISAGGAIDSAISSATDDLIARMDEELGDIRNGLIDADTIRGWIADAVNNFASDLQQYLVWSDESGLSIKAKNDEGQESSTYLNLQNDILAFIYSGTMPAWMTHDTFNINNLIVHETASIVGLIFQKVTYRGERHLRAS